MAQNPPLGVMEGFAMLTLVAGLVLFLGVHSVRVFAEGWRTATIAFSRITGPPPGVRT